MGLINIGFCTLFYSSKGIKEKYFGGTNISNLRRLEKEWEEQQDVYWSNKNADV